MNVDVITLKTMVKLDPHSDPLNPYVSPVAGFDLTAPRNPFTELLHIIPGRVSLGVTAVETILNVAALVNGFSDLGDTHSDYIQGLIGERPYSGTGSQASGEFEKSLYEN